jgi:hypothetical protein
MAKEGGGWGAYMAKGGPLRPLWPKKGRLGSAYMTKREGGTAPFGHPTPTGCLHGQRRGGERLPLWPSLGVPTWPKREVGEPFGPLWPSPKGGSLHDQRRGGRGSPSASLAIPHLREAGAYMAIPSGWGGPYGQKRDGHPDGQKSIWPSPPFGLWESGSLWP